MTIGWVSRQWSRFDLSLTKLLRPLVAINTISNVSVAVAIAGLPILALILISGSFVIGIIGYILHRIGFFMGTVNETFDQQQKHLYQRQIRFMSARIALCNRMTPKELEKELEESMEGLRL